MSVNVIKDQTEYKKLHNEEYTTDRDDKHCTICGCPQSKKTASLDSDCGLSIYNEQNQNNIQKLKWTKFNETTK